MDYDKKQSIVEVYTCIQTEGSMQGRPNILIRTTGCTHRCQFGENDWCDSWYTSIHPEKGKFSLNDVIEIIDNNSHIKNLMITGGSATMHPLLLNELTIIAKSRDLFITLETEGSHYVETDYPIDLISLSPKFYNSVPILGTKTPLGDIVDQKFINQHNKYRMNYAEMIKMIASSKDYHLKPVVHREQKEIWDAIKLAQHSLNVPNNKVWIMPAGGTLEVLQPNYAYCMEECIKRGYNFTGRAQIVAYNDKRGV